jgi:hypothetical protein
MISERYTRWVAMLAQSDANLVLLAAIALALVAAWQVTPRLPAPWAGRLRVLEMLGGLIVVAEVISGIQPSPAAVVVGGLAVSLVLAVVNWIQLSRPARKNLEV